MRQHAITADAHADAHEPRKVAVQRHAKLVHTAARGLVHTERRQGIADHVEASEHMPRDGCTHMRSRQHHLTHMRRG